MHLLFHFVAQTLFPYFGKRPLGQLVGATVIGALLGLFFLDRPGGLVTVRPTIAILAGAGFGFSAGQLLIAPRLLFGVPLTVFGVAILSSALRDKETWAPGDNTAWVVIAGGLLLTFLGLLLTLWSIRTTPHRNLHENFVEAETDANAFPSVDSDH